MKKGVLKNCSKLIGKHQFWSLLFNKVPGLRPATILKKRPQEHLFLQNTYRGLLLRVPTAENSIFEHAPDVRSSKRKNSYQLLQILDNKYLKVACRIRVAYLKE